MLLRFVMSRGDSIRDRHLLFGLVFLLPFVLYAFRTLLDKSIRKTILVSLLSSALVLSSFGLGKVGDYPYSLSVTHQEPYRIINVVNWLKQTPYKNKPALLTKMAWNSTYFSQYYPPSSKQTLILSLWITEADLENFLNVHSSFLLITRVADYELQRWFSEHSGVSIDKEDAIYEYDDIRVYYLTL